MGNLSTSLFCTKVSAPDNKTKHYLDKICQQDVKLGGGYDFTGGGYESLADYGNSMFSKTKENLIRSIAKDVAGILKISPSFAEKADLKDVINKFTKIVPDPRKGRKIKTDGKIHVEVCKKLGDAINKNYKLDLVNKDATPEQICQVVSELLYSLFTGLQSEFFTISADVSRIVKNLTALQEYVDGMNKKIITDLGECSDSDAAPFKESYEALTREINRQHAYLTNLVSGVIGPTSESLIHLVEENKEFPGLSSDLRNDAGTREFSDHLSYMMSGVSSIAHATYLVDKALKTIGMSVSEYKNTKNMKDLKSKIYHHMVKKNPNSKDLDKYMIAADILYRNDLAHDDIATQLSKKGGEIMDITGGDDDGFGFADMVSDNLYRDRDSVFQGRRYAQKGSITTQLKTRERYREKLFQSLNQQIQSCYNEIILELYKIGKKIGSEIPVTDKLHYFIRQLGYFSGVQPDRKNLYKALSGYTQDVKSEYIKHDFIRALETVSSASLELSSGSAGTYFKSLASAINKLTTIISDFNETFTKTLTEVHVDAPEKTKGGNTDVGQINMLEMTLGGSLKDSDFKYLVTIKKAIREIEYYFKISNIKTNLKLASVQSVDYSKNYENILGEECGMLIDRINTQAKYLTCSEDDIGSTKSVNGVVNVKGCEPRSIIDQAIKANHGSKDAYENTWKGYVFLIEYIRSAKVEMIEAAQALDLYLSKFAADTQANPNDIKDFVKMLEQIEIVAKWFTDKSGDNLVNVFESFQWGVNESDVRAPLPGTQLPAGGTSQDGATLDINRHYYETLNSGPGQYIPGYVLNTLPIISEKQVKTFIIRIEKTFKSMRALENIISTFSKLSSKLSGDNIQTFMSPGMIFKAFMKYSVATSIAVGQSQEIKDYKTFIAEHAAPVGFTINKVLPVFSFSLQTASILPRTKNGNSLNSPVNTWYNRYDPLDFKHTPQTSYLSTDEIFEMSIKSLVSKVFVVVGSYSLFQRPAKDFDNNLSFVNRPLRQIMGGGSAIKIIPEAIELYIRLPLLAEWYREIFKFRKGAAGTADDILVSMIPGFDGIWSDFVKVIFVDGDGIDDGGYTASFTEQIIRSINDIYTHYKPKYGANMCAKVLENFVSEVNLRYGLVKQKEIDKYITERNAGLSNTDEYESDENVDYDILDSKDQFGRKPAPSDRFRRVGVNHSLGKGNITTSKAFKDEVDKFREKVEMALNLSSFSNLSPLSSNNFGELSPEFASVDDLVKQTISRIHDSKTDDEKYSIVQNVVLGAERFSEFDYDEMLLFHETVINPLTVLHVIYRILNNYNKFYNSLDVGEGFKVLKERITSAVSTWHTTNQPINFNDFRAELQKRMKTGNNQFFNDPECYFTNVDDYKLYINDTTGDPIHGRSYLNVLSTSLDSFRWYQIYNINANGGVPGRRGLTQQEQDDYNDLYVRCFMRKRNIMYESINQLYYLTCDRNALVELSFSGDGQNRFPMLKFNKIEKVTTELYENVKESLTKFRKILPHSEIAKYESLDNKDYKVNNKPMQNITSLFYIKEHLFDRLFKNKYGGGLSDANNSFKNMWLYLTHEWKHSGVVIPADGPILFTTDNDEEKYDSYDSVISKLTYWYIKQPVQYGGVKTLLNSYSQFPLSKTGVTNENSLLSSRGGSINESIIKKIEGVVSDLVTWYDPILPNPLPATPELATLQKLIINSQIPLIANTSIHNNVWLNAVMVETNARRYNTIPIIPLQFNPFHQNPFIPNINVAGLVANPGGIKCTMFQLLNSVTNTRDLNLLHFTIAVLERVLGVTPLNQVVYEILNKYKRVYDIAYTMALNGLFTYTSGTVVPEFISRKWFDDRVMLLKKTAANTLSDLEVSSLNTMFRTLDDSSPIDTLSIGVNTIYDYNDSGPIESTDNFIHNVELLTAGNVFGNLGLIQKLNNLIYKYIQIFTDSGNNKIYLPLLEQFANGLNASEIMGGKAIDDITVYKSYGQYNSVFTLAEIENQQAIFVTVAQAIKSIVTAKIQAPAVSILKLAEKDLMNVSDYMKDLMTAYLPIFEKELTILSCKADLIKSLLENTRIKVHRNRHAKGIDLNASSNINGVNIPNVHRTWHGSALAQNADAELSKVVNAKIGLKLKNADVMLNADRKGFLISMLSHISGSAKSLTSCVKNTYKELMDVPLYFETYKNSISDYQDRNNIMPLMPLSHVSYLLNTSNHLVNDDRYNLTYEVSRGGLIPCSNIGVGSSAFKFAYGTRGLLGYNDPSIDLAPGVTSILNIYNSKVGGAASYDKRKMGDTFNNTVLLLRYATDYIYHKTALGDGDINKCIGFTKQFVENAEKIGTPGQAPMNIVTNLSCQTANHGLYYNTEDQIALNANLIPYNRLKVGRDAFFTSQTNITLLIDNDNYKQSVYRLLSCITQTNQKNARITNMNRKTLRVYNILDSNIVPINFHALQSEIPLVNIMNYSYTFDHMVKNFIGIESKLDNVRDIPVKYIDEFPAGNRTAKIASTLTDMQKYSKPEDSLVRMLIAPRGSRKVNEFSLMTWRIMAGDTSLNLNKPKYLSDQLWNKVLLQSLYMPEVTVPNMSGTSWTANPAAPGTNFNELQIPDARLRGNVNNRAFPTDLPELEVLTYGNPTDNPPSGFLTGMQTSSHVHTFIYKDNANKRQQGYSVMSAYPNTGSAAIASRWNKEGYIRYQTKIVRYIEWFVHLQRVMRFLMRGQLEWVNDPIVNQSNAIAEEITEYRGNNTFQLKDFE